MVCIIFGCVCFDYEFYYCIFCVYIGRVVIYIWLSFEEFFFDVKQIGIYGCFFIVGNVVYGSIIVVSRGVKLGQYFGGMFIDGFYL